MFLQNLKVNLIFNSLLNIKLLYAKHFCPHILHFLNFVFCLLLFSDHLSNVSSFVLTLSSPQLYPAVVLHQLFVKLVILQLGLRRQERLPSSWLTVKLTERGNPLVLFTHCFPHTDD